MRQVVIRVACSLSILIAATVLVVTLRHLTFAKMGGTEVGVPLVVVVVALN